MSIRDNVSRYEVQDILGIKKNAAVNILNEMVKEKLIRVYGNARSTKYKLRDI